MVIIELLNEFLKLYYGPIPKKEYIIDKLAVKVWKWIYVWINECFFKFSFENVVPIPILIFADSESHWV